MITTASAIITGLVLTICRVDPIDEAMLHRLSLQDVKTEECEIYIPATYETKTVELGKELCIADFRKYVNEAMQDEEYYVDDVKCQVMNERK